MKKFFAYLKKEDGAVAIIMAVAMVALLGFTAFAVDVGMVNAEKSEFQTACDSAALAAGYDLPDTAKATQTAQTYIEKNGFEKKDITVTFEEDDQKIVVSGSKQMTAMFGKALGKDKLNCACKSAVLATPAMGDSSFGPAFDYVIYSGNVYPDEQPGYGSFRVRLQNLLDMTASGNTVYGNIHSNYRVNTFGNTIFGNVSAVDTVTGGNIQKESLPGADLVPMPDFSMYKEQIKAEAIAAGQYYSGNFSIANASSVNLTEPLYVEGDANLSGISFSGNGTIYAGGKITITGSGTSYDSNSKICMYSDHTSNTKADEAISFGGSDKDITGILYAPNGSIDCTGSNYVFRGNIIGRVVHITGSSKEIYPSSDISEAFPYISTSGANVSVRLVQ